MVKKNSYLLTYQEERLDYIFFLIIEHYFFQLKICKKIKSKFFSFFSLILSYT